MTILTALRSELFRQFIAQIVPGSIGSPVSTVIRKNKGTGLQGARTGVG
jgi:hypothetical protein